MHNTDAHIPSCPDWAAPRLAGSADRLMFRSVDGIRQGKLRGGSAAFNAWIALVEQMTRRISTS
jgi:hypothetical protein